MGENTNIPWTDATINWWWGCTKVGPGCDHCYAETFDRRVGGAHWGTGVERRKIKSAPHTMKKLRARPTRTKVFIQSMSDLFDLEVPVEWFQEAWGHIEVATELNIQLVTKRISVVEKRLAQRPVNQFGVQLPWPWHVGLMITVVNQDEADRDIPRLLALKAKMGIPWVGLSVEPMLGPLELASYFGTVSFRFGSVDSNNDGIDWVICGGESGPNARDNDFENNARDLLAQCKAAKVPFFGKQNVKKKPLPADLMVREWPAAFA